MNHVAQLAKAPHPVGSAAHAQARDYILSQLIALGLKPEIQETSVSNIVASIKGSRPTKALLLVAHYDTVESSPGAGDDSSGIAVMLETARAIQASGPLNNDVIFLFSDGEEAGLLGAKAFVNQHPSSRDVGLVLNFEARGVNGPSIMFETSDGNGWLIRQAAQAAPSLIASSLSYDVYKLLPNDTDLTVFKDAGFAGFNFAFIGGSQHYHAPTDDLAHLDERSVQQHGSNALAFTRHFGNLDLTNTRTDDVVYFNLFGSRLIIYSRKLVVPVTVAISVLLLACIAIGIRRQRLTFPGMSSGSTAFLVSAGAGLFAGIVIRLIADALHSVLTISGDTLLLLSAIAIAAVTGIIYLRFSSKTSVLNLVAGSLFWWLMPALLTSLFLPGASYVFVWPLLFNTLGLGLAVLYTRQSQPPLWTTIVVSILAAPAILLMASTIYLTCLALTIDSLLFSILLALSVALLTIPFIPVIQRAFLESAKRTKA
ncbi:MAG TPA: M20/M25/M40 family metallo-hydrolase [Pyrinomonadaceae bacterium]|jgi:hypothetical protein